MIVIPAIDLKDGHCVRLKRGNMDEATVFSDDPVATAGKWLNTGARRLHLVDLNGAFQGTPMNAQAVEAIHREYPDFPLQIGGGIRSMQTIERYLHAGVSWVIIGTKAVENPSFVKQACQQFKGHIIVGIDARDGMVATDGWANTSSVNALDLAKQFSDDGVSAIIYTDINRDGMMQGVNVSATQAIANVSPIPIIASGGITNMNDIKALTAVSDSNKQTQIMGAITGRAIYEGTLNLTQAQQYCDQQAKELDY